MVEKVFTGTRTEIRSGLYMYGHTLKNGRTVKNLTGRPRITKV